MTVMGNEFSGLPMGELIGAPLSAACDAQVRLAKATADFINTVGFEQPAGDNKDGAPAGRSTARKVDFSFVRPSQEMSEDKETGKKVAKLETVELSVPLLAILNVPSLMVKSVDIVFDMEVKSAEASKDSSDSEGSFDATGKAGWGPFSLEVHVHGSIAAHKENTRSTDKSAKYHVEVHARDDGMPEGLARVLDIVQSAIAPIAISKPADAAANDPSPAPAPASTP
ncbi:DUF2589 domain-containing protein [Nannocystis sp. RBIL2]|uniref:DUF2589 domain-containing protein n=1 Tax=Nannocystis sp. RBIL2 TaxID=2996788 RepID=UPI00227139D4|nr:DUF2589 domain-containing protein [Nannocystis sp. RBIL2]MCY1065260.1 DUF2589 domain-containing protein [Nannocystis sp. RBIL2]